MKTFNTMTATFLSSILLISPSLVLAQRTDKKETVAELLARAQQTSRGAGAALSNKASTNLPFSNMGFKKDPNAQKVDLNSVKPPKSSAIMRADPPQGDQAQYEKILDQQINELFKLTQRFKDSANRGELWLRLAELYVEKATLVDGRIQDTYDRKLKDFQDGKIKIKPVLNQQPARAYNKRAIQLYEWFQRDFPQDTKMAQALFFLGYNYFELGEVKKGAEYYDRLVKTYPQSPFVGEAQFALGEYYFENDQWANAYKSYSYLLKRKAHRLHSFSLYKSAWCLFRLGKYDQALKYLEYIIKLEASNQESVAGKKVNNNRLETEAQRDLVIFYAEAEKPENAAKYFRKIVGGDAYPYLEKLAYYYSDRGNREAATDVFKLLISERPQHPKSFEYQYQIVQSLYYAKNTSAFKNEMVQWVKGYGVRSQWYQTNKDNKDLIDNANKLRETTLRNYVLQQHQTAQNSRAEFSQKSALEGYQLYFDEFSALSGIGDMRFYYGELLYDMSRFDEAYVQYKWVADNAPQSQFYEKAGQNMLISAERTLPKDSELQSATGSSLDPIAMDTRVDRFIIAARGYIEKFPKGERVAEIKFRMGRLYYQHNRFDEAAALFRDIVEKHPKTKYSEYSANLLLDIFNLRKDYAGMEKAGAELLAVPAIANSKAGSDIRGVLEKASFKKGQEQEVAKDYSGSADTFISFAASNPGSPLAVTALFNAGVNYERAFMPGKAIAAHEQVLASTKPEAKNLKPKSRRLVAKLYQDSYRFEEAAKAYRLAYEESPKDPLAANLLFNAAALYEALGRRNDAIQSYTNYLSLTKSAAERAEVVFTLATLHRKAAQNSSAITRYTEYTSSSAKESAKEVESAYWLAQLNSSKSERDKWKSRVYSTQKRVGTGASFAAKLKLDDAKASLRELVAIRFPANPSKQKAAVDRKTASLNRVLSELSEVIKLDSAEELVGALALIGDANDDMANTILETPQPPGLNPEELKQYQAGVSQFAAGFQAKAKEAYAKAVERGHELQVYSPEFKRSYAYMNRLNPQEYYLNNEVTQDVRFVNWMNQ